MKRPTLPCDLIPCGDRPVWLSERRNRFHSTDAAMGLAKGQWLRVFADKTAPGAGDEPEEWQRIKLASEATVRTIAQWKFGGKVHAWPATTICVSREHPWLAATPDGLLEDDDNHEGHDGPGVHQIKCWSELDREGWRDGRPLYVQVQNQIELLVTGCTWGATDVMFGTQVVERFEFVPDPEFLAAALPVLKAFWSNVQLGIPPAPDASREATQALGRLHPYDDGLTVQLPEAADRQIDRLQVKADLVRDAQRQVDQIENELRAALGDHTYGVTPNGRWVSWKTTAAGHRVFRMAGRPAGPIEYAPGSVANASDYANAPTPQQLKEKWLAEQGHRCGLCNRVLKTGSLLYLTEADVVCCGKCAIELANDVAVSFTTNP